MLYLSQSHSNECIELYADLFTVPITYLYCLGEGQVYYVYLPSGQEGLAATPLTQAC